MALIFNLDLDNNTKITNYGFNRTSSPPNPVIYFRLYKNGYAFDMTSFQKLTLRYRISSTNEIHSFEYTTLETINGEKLVKVEVSESLLTKNDKLIISPTVRISNQSVILKEFQLIVYEGNKQEMDMVKHGLERFNHLYGQYIKAIKRDQINQSNGVVELDGKGKISVNKLQDFIVSHIPDKIHSKVVHGLTINPKTYMLDYYDSDADRFYQVNSVNGGEFKYLNKDSEFDIYGGSFGNEYDGNIIHGGSW